MQFTLLVPELLWFEAADPDALAALDCPALCTLLTRSRFTRRPPQSLEATLSDAFGLPEDAPYAAFRLLGEADAVLATSDASWTCCDPVHLRYQQDRLILADMRRFGITLDEAQALAEALNSELADIGRIHVATAERWYLQLADTLLLEGFDAPPLSVVSGRSIERLLVETMQTRGLRKLFNEIQMILHAHPINQQRENERRPAINGLWLWGAGSLPARTESRFDGVWSSNPLARGLAHAAGVPAHPVPLDAATLLDHAAKDTHHLLVLEDALEPVHNESSASYRDALLGLETRWFAPLQSALSSGKIKQLLIETSTAYGVLAWDTTRRDQWKFWQRPQTLAALAKELAKE